MSLSVSIKHSFKGFALDVSFDAPRGVTALFGRSGAGKTTVVNTVAGLLKPDAGRIVSDGTVLVDRTQSIFLPPHQRHVGYVFQDGRLFPHLSVRQNLLYGAPRDHVDDLTRITGLLGIQSLLDRHPGALSGGEKQRVAIGRALLTQPRLLLMDEPLAALDAARKAEILPYIERLSDEAGIPILYVTHSLSEVARLASTLVVLADGRVARTGPANSLLADPASAPLLGLREAGAVINAHVVQHTDDGLTELEAAGGRLFLPRIKAPPGQSVRLRIHAHDVILALKPPEDISALNILSAKISQIHPGDGPGVMVALQAGDAQLLARVTQRSAKVLNLRKGLKVYAVLKSVAPAQTEVSAAV